MVPVNRWAKEIEGRECLQSLRKAPTPVDGVLVMTPASETLEVVEDCADAGIQDVWLYRAGGKGAVSPEAIAFCEAKGIRVIEGHCPFMFLRGTAFPHRAHGFFLKLTRRYPKSAA